MSGDSHGDSGSRPLPAWVRRRAQPPAPSGAFQPPPPPAPPPPAPPPSTGSPGRPPRVPKPPKAARPRSAGRRLDASAVGILSLGLPWLLYSAAIVAAVASPFGMLLFALPLWALSGVLVFFRPVESGLARLLYRYRRPSPRELDILRPAWEAVAAAGGVHPGDYQLWIQNSQDINASAAAGHLVAVTRRAIDTMPPHQLRAVLAHELGHHAAGHAWSGLLLHWYSLPARLFNRLLVWASKAIIWALLAVVRIALAVLGGTMTVAAAMPGITGVATLAAICIMLGYFGMTLAGSAEMRLLVAYALFAPPVVAAFATASAAAMAWLTRRGELHADLAAARLGYGPALLDTFEDWLRAAPAVEPTFGDRVFATHPPLAVRVQKLKSVLGIP